MVNYQEEIKTLKDKSEMLEKNNILQPYDILGGYSICDFYTFEPDVIFKGLEDDALEARFKNTILMNFLDIEYFDQHRIEELTELGVILNPLEVPIGMNMIDPI